MKGKIFLQKNILICNALNAKCTWLYLKRPTRCDQYTSPLYYMSHSVFKCECNNSALSIQQHELTKTVYSEKSKLQWWYSTMQWIELYIKNPGLSLRAGGRRFSLATTSLSPGYFEFDTERKYYKEKNVLNYKIMN